MNIDYQIFQFLHRLAGIHFLLDWIIVFCAKYLIFVMGFIFILILIVYKKGREKFHLFFIINTFGIGILLILVSHLIGMISFRLRPFVTYDFIPLVYVAANEKAFPSDHATVAFFVAFLLLFYRRNLGILFIVLASLVSVARIVAGVHYPVDIVGGMVLGLLGALFIRWAFLSRMEL